MNIDPSAVVEALRAQISDLVVQIAMRDVAIAELQKQLAQAPAESVDADI